MAIARPIWSGTVNFGPVSVPVKLLKATGEVEGVSFRQLCPDCKLPIKEIKTCPTSGNPVEGDLLSGYQDGGEMIVFSKSEVSELRVQSQHTIDIEDFVRPGELPAEVFVREVYYLEPQQVGVRAYSLLRAALAKTGAIGIGKVAMRNKERLCALRVVEGHESLVLNTLSWPSEVRPDPIIPAVKVDERELKMAGMLIDTMLTPFDPLKFKDTFGAAVRQQVEARRNGAQKPAEGKKGGKKAPDAMDTFAELAAAVKAAKSKRGKR